MSQNQCPNCNTPVMPEAVFCHQCGHPISNAAPQPGSWTRIWARLLDLWLDAFILDYCLTLTPLGNYLPVHNKLILIMVFTLFTLLLDCAVFAVCGSTLGKFLFGIKMVENSGEPLKGAKYFQRNLRFYFSGIALGLPLISLGTAIWQESRIRHGKQTSYDEALGCKPIVYKDSTLKKAVGLIILIALIALFVLAQLPFVWEQLPLE